MIIVRHTHRAKAGKRQEIVELLKEWVKLMNVSGRVLTVAGPGQTYWDTVEIDVEWESREDLDKFWADYDWSQPSVTEMHEKLDELREPGSTSVTWHVR